MLVAAGSCNFEYMKDILELEMDPETGAQPKLEPVFRLDEINWQSPCAVVQYRHRDFA